MRISPFSSVLKTPLLSPTTVPSAYKTLNSAFCKVTEGFTEQTLRISKIPSGALENLTVTTLCSPLSASMMVSEDWIMLYPSAASTSSSTYAPGLRPVHMAVPFFPVTLVPMTVPPVPLVPPKYRSWNVQPGRAAPVTLSYFSTITAFFGTFSNVITLLSPPLI